MDESLSIWDTHSDAWRRNRQLYNFQPRSQSSCSLEIPTCLNWSPGVGFIDDYRSIGLGKWIPGHKNSSDYQCACLRVPERLSTMGLNRTSLELCQNLPGRSSTLTPPRILLKSTFCVCRSLEKRNTRCVVNFLGRASSLAPPIQSHFRKNEHIFLDQISRISLHHVGKHPKIGSGDLKSWLRNVYWSVWERSIICLGLESLPSEEIEFNSLRTKRTRIWDLRQFHV